ncbi:phosphotriesterase [Streptomyces sp. NPDC052042]|uniref:phosphotriesterase n=1 Tax=Streptomyces sp. NPDC052042 TaxID=3365683 RepID=UPI0037D883FA
MMPEIMTVTGPVAARNLGLTLMHEHLLINQMREQRRTGLVADHSLLLDEIGAFAGAGGGTIVDLTSGELADGAARDPLGLYAKGPSRIGDTVHTRGTAHARELRSLAVESGVNVVAGTGHYRDPYLDRRWFDRHSVDEIAELLIADITLGFPGTDVRAGIIGEIGADKWYVSAAEERSFRAAARAHLRTGVPVSTHAARWPVGLAQLEILRSEGVDPAHVIIGHCDSVPIPEYHLDLARAGAWVQFDGIRAAAGRDLRNRVEWVLALCREGFHSRVLLSHDVCTLEDFRANGGCGLTLVPTLFLDELVKAGLDPEEARELLRGNPARALAGG